MTHRALLSLLTGVAALALGPAPGAAQAHPATDTGQSCTLCSPWVFVQGAALYRADEALPSARSDNWTPAVRALVEVGTPSPHLGLFASVEFTPADGPTPMLEYGLQVWLRPRFRSLNVTGGVGLVHERNGIGEVGPGEFEIRGWGQVGVEYQTRFHEIALYGLAGTAFSGEAGVTYQVGIRHPLAPWRFHVMP